MSENKNLALSNKSMKFVMSPQMFECLIKFDDKTEIVRMFENLNVDYTNILLLNLNKLKPNDNCKILDESIQLLKNILEICPSFDISGQDNLILSAILQTNYYIVANFFKLAKFDFYRNITEYLCKATDLNVIIGLMNSMKQHKSHILNDAFIRHVYELCRFDIMHAETIVAINVMFRDLQSKYQSVSYESILLLSSVKPVFKCVSDYLEKYHTNENMAKSDTVTRKLFNLSVKLAKGINDNTIIYLDQLKYLNVDQQMKIKSMCLITVRELLARDISLIEIAQDKCY